MEKLKKEFEKVIDEAVFENDSSPDLRLYLKHKGKQQVRTFPKVIYEKVFDTWNAENFVKPILTDFINYIYEK